ncbi:hypothetical protein [Cronobacter malonaticus]|uniref:hypothetical protein n=1 Tax=Cronobacter malonaticus TaxID=413503 RepID=UPI0012BD4345
MAQSIQGRRVYGVADFSCVRGGTGVTDIIGKIRGDVTTGLYNGAVKFAVFSFGCLASELIGYVLINLCEIIALNRKTAFRNVVYNDIRISCKSMLINKVFSSFP